MKNKTDLLSSQNIDDLDAKKFILVKGARVNNLKNINVAIPRNKLTVITGVSGSGKSSLAFDTLFAEGQRMYVESLSSYARQFLGRMEKPEVDWVKGISPAIAIEQKVATKNPRSTVGTTTEIYDYMKLLFSRVGKTISPVSGKEVKKHSVSDAVDFVLAMEDNEKVFILTPIDLGDGRTFQDHLKILLQQGFARVFVNEELTFIEDLIETGEQLNDAFLLIDRVSVKDRDELELRLSDSVQTAFYEGNGKCVFYHNNKFTTYSDKFELDGIEFELPSVNFFSFNNPFGACKTCEGFGHVLGIDKDLVIPDKNLSIHDNALAPWKGEKMSATWLEPLLRSGIEFDFPIHRPFNELSDEEKEVIWTGNEHFQGLNDFFLMLEGELHKIQYRVMLSRYRGRTVCPDCRGTRLRGDASNVKIDGKSIQDVVLLSIEEAKVFFKEISLTQHEQDIAKRILAEIQNRLDYLLEVGLSYLSLNRLTSTLSGGEYQRIKLATSLGSALVGSMYILDEPSIGLHPKDTSRLVQVLQNLKNLGNSVIVVEHEEEVMKAADYMLDIGPDAGTNGGQLMAQGTLDEIVSEGKTLTSDYLSGRRAIEVPDQRRKWINKIQVKGARENNLQNVDVEIPLNVFVAITGVSGSGKSTLVKRIIYPGLQKIYGDFNEISGKFDEVSGDLNAIKAIEYVDQNPIGKSSRSNPVTYVKAYDAIRTLFSEIKMSKDRGYKPSHFSFNVDGGRCEECQGEGTVRIEMQFMADIFLTCDSCKGKRFKQEVIDVQHNGKSISDVLNLTVDEAVEFFNDQPKIIEKIRPLQKVGLGYVQLGQSSNTLSGGEAQRVKLAFYLSKGDSLNKTLFIFDEPTTGLHFHDIQKLLTSLNALIDNGHSVLVIEHNLEVVKTADWIIDLGPEGGDKGGNIVFSGLPEDLVKCKESITGKYLKEKL